MAATITVTTPEALDLPFTVGGRAFRSRLMVGTGKYASNAQMVRAIEVSGAEVVTVAVRRVNLDRSREEGILYHLDPKRWFLLANTAGCYSADEAVRYARLGREAGFNDFVKLEVIADQETLLGRIQALEAQIACTPPPPAPAAHDHGKHKGEKRKHHGHGKKGD